MNGVSATSGGVPNRDGDAIGDAGTSRRGDSIQPTANTERWSLASYEVNGEQFTIERLRRGGVPDTIATGVDSANEDWKQFQVLLIDNRTCSFQTDSGQGAARFHYSLNDEASPRQITLESSALSLDAPAPGGQALLHRKTVRGIVREDKAGHITLAIAAHDHDYPRSFSSEGEDVVILRYVQDESWGQGSAKETTAVDSEAAVTSMLEREAARLSELSSSVDKGDDKNGQISNDRPPTGDAGTGGS